MAMCAIASARARDGASFSSQYGFDEQSLDLQSSSETFQQLAETAIPKDLEAARGLDFMRAFALLALTSIQLGDIPSMHKHLGAYHTLVSMDSLHDETRWPKGLTIVETEERRRLVCSPGDHLHHVTRIPVSLIATDDGSSGPSTPLTSSPPLPGAACLGAGSRSAACYTPVKWRTMTSCRPAITWP